MLGLALLGLPTAAQAQKKYSSAKRGRNGQVKSITTNNLPGYDDRRFRPGFYVGVNASRYRLEHSQAYVDRLRIGQGFSANSKVTPGFAVGFVGDMRLADYFNLRFTPGVSFLARQVEFENAGSSQEVLDQEVGTTQLDLPLLLKYKSERRRNTRVYLVGGGRYSFNVGNRRRDPERNQLRLNDSEFALEYGVGLDLFYPFFKFAPELRFSHGLTNLVDPSAPDIYTGSFQRVRSSTVTLYFNFE